MLNDKKTSENNVNSLGKSAKATCDRKCSTYSFQTNNNDFVPPPVSDVKENAVDNSEIISRGSDTHRLDN